MKPTAAVGDLRGAKHGAAQPIPNWVRWWLPRVQKHEGALPDLVSKAVVRDGG